MGGVVGFLAGGLWVDLVVGFVCCGVVLVGFQCWGGQVVNGVGVTGEDEEFWG